jgi:hypothetical protein
MFNGNYSIVDNYEFLFLPSHQVKQNNYLAINVLCKLNDYSIKKNSIGNIYYDCIIYLQLFRYIPLMKFANYYICLHVIRYFCQQINWFTKVKYYYGAFCTQFNNPQKEYFQFIFKIISFSLLPRLRIKKSLTSFKINFNI